MKGDQRIEYYAAKVMESLDGIRPAVACNITHRENEAIAFLHAFGLSAQRSVCAIAALSTGQGCGFVSGPSPRFRTTSFQLGMMIIVIVWERDLCEPEVRYETRRIACS